MPMSARATIIRDPVAADEAAWRQLWAGYTAFYQTSVPNSVTARTWQRILDPEAPIFGRLAVFNRVVIGFSVGVLHEGTWTIAPICYLEDLFVDPNLRGQGFGRRLMQDMIVRAKSKGCSRLYWHTRASNPARHLYDKFVQADDFVRYRLFLA
jgi:GNAT superfamily N-acetyltransferase